MNRFKLGAFRKEFTFLNETVLGMDPEIRVERVDVRWLGRRAEDREEETSSVSYREVDKVYLVVGGGLESLEMFPVGSRERREGESLLEALNRWAGERGDLGEITFLVWRSYHYDHTEPDAPRWSNVWTILRPDRGVTLAQRIAEAEAQALAEVKHEAAF